MKLNASTFKVDFDKNLIRFLVGCSKISFVKAFSMFFFEHYFLNSSLF